MRGESPKPLTLAPLRKGEGKLNEAPRQIALSALNVLSTGLTIMLVVMIVFGIMMVVMTPELLGPIAVLLVVKLLLTRRKA